MANGGNRNRQRRRRRPRRNNRGNQNQQPAQVTWRALLNNAPGVFLGLAAFHFMIGGPEVRKIYTSSGVAIAALLALIYFLTRLPGVNWLVKGQGKKLDKTVRTQVWIGIAIFFLLSILASAWR